MKNSIIVYSIAACCGISAALVGCGGGSSGGEETRLSLAVSDAPLDDAEKVVIFFDQIELNALGGERRVFAVCDDQNDDGICEPDDTTACEFYDGDQPVQVDLLQYQGSDVFTLLDAVEVPPGEYQWMRVRICNGDGTQDRSYVEIWDDDGHLQLQPLVVKRGSGTAEGEIQLDKFVLATGVNQFVVEFDLRRSLVEPQNKNDDSIYLKPRGVRLENAVEVGHLAGEVSTGLREACVAEHPDDGTELDNSYSHVVYLYPGDIALSSMDDDADLADSGLVLPLAATAVVYDDGSDTYRYEFGYVAEGEYSLGYSCLGHNDAPENNDTYPDNGFELYRGHGPIDVVAGQTAIRDLAL